jgi:acetolactate synthase-1/2/3 large subunit
VHIELPEDVAEKETDAVVQKRSEMRIPYPNLEAVRKAASMICEAKNPLRMVFSGANRKGITEELWNLATKTDIYLVHTHMGKGVVPEDCIYSLVATGIHSIDYINYGIDGSDLVITVGYNIAEYPPYLWNGKLDKRIINIDFVESVPDRYFNPTVKIIGDVTSSIRELAASIQEKREFPFFEKTRYFIEKKINASPPIKYPPLPQSVVQSVKKVLGREDIITLNNGIYKLWFSRLYKTYAPNTVLLDNTLAAMGGGLSAGITAKLLHPKRRVLAICGDGGFMINCQELETATRYEIPVVVLILNDNAVGFIKWEQKKINFEDFGLDYGNPDFALFTESFGAAGFKVREGDDLAEILERSFSLNKVTVIECPIDYSANYDTFSIELRNLKCEF